jgi:mRNA interferase YafQ
MRIVERSTAFRRDYRRAKATPRHREDLERLVTAVVTMLLSDEVLPDSNRDHSLSGDWAGYRECHIKPDLLLIYRKPDASTLRLARLGTHSELFA